MRTGDSLACEGLKILDGVLGRVGEEFTEYPNTFIVFDMNAWFIMERFTMQILKETKSVLASLVPAKKENSSNEVQCGWRLT